MEEKKLYRGNLRDLVILLALGSALLRFFPLDTDKMIVALVLLGLGTLLHVVTKATLIRNKVVCDEGVYKLCRHPYYLANFTVDISLCLLSGNIYLVLLYPFLFFWAYGPTLKFEEGKLTGLHGEKYTQYLLQVPQVFPNHDSITGLGRILNEVSASRISKKEWVRITRFWAVALILIVTHKVGMAGVKILYVTPVDLTAVSLTAGAVMLLAFSLVLRLLRQPKSAPQD
jgi:hypothetical protein